VQQERYFVWDGLSIAEERTTPGGAPYKKFYQQGVVYDFSVGPTFASDPTGTHTKFYYTRDHLGSVREVTAEDGTLVCRYEYDPYGTATRHLPYASDPAPSPVPDFESDFLFTGHLYHKQSGLYLAPYRAYDPALGRWLSREPLGLDGPNLYHYVFGDPINGVDPTGLQTQELLNPNTGRPFADGIANDSPTKMVGPGSTPYTRALAHTLALNIVTNTIPVGRMAQLGSGLVKAAAGRVVTSNCAQALSKSLIPKIGGRLPINSKFAGLIHPSGVPFTARGFPDFSSFAKAQVQVKGLTGNYAKDAAMANQAVGLKVTPTDYVWHHVEDGLTMQLVPKAIHNATRHTGGAAVIRNGGFDL